MVANAYNVEYEKLLLILAVQYWLLINWFLLKQKCAQPKLGL